MLDKNKNKSKYVWTINVLLTIGCILTFIKIYQNDMDIFSMIYISLIFIIAIVLYIIEKIYSYKEQELEFFRNEVSKINDEKIKADFLEKMFF